MADEESPSAPAPAAPTSVKPFVYKKLRPGDSGVEKKNVGVGEKTYRWTWDGEEFSWECQEKGTWYKLFGKKRFREVLKAMRGEDGRPWNSPHVVKMDTGIHVHVSRRTPSNKKAKIDEFRLEADFPGVKALEIFSCLNEHMYRATWDHNMLKGYNISRFARNNDIGYYHAKMPVIQNRDFCNQRGWIELGKERYVIANFSTPHPNCPVKSGATRGVSFSTAYYIRPAQNDPTGCTLTYLTCTDPAGWIPSTLINMVTQKAGPESICNLAKASQGLQQFITTQWDEYQRTKKIPKGPWDHTWEPAGTYVPRDPNERPVYRLEEQPFGKEQRELEELIKQQHDEEKELTAEENDARIPLQIDVANQMRGVGMLTDGPAVTQNIARKASLKLGSGGGGGGGGGGKQQNGFQSNTAVESAIQKLENETTQMKERLAIFARTSGSDPLTQQPADEPDVCRTFRKSVAAITANVSKSLTSEGDVENISVEDYLSRVLNVLELSYPIPDDSIPHHPGFYDELYTTIIEYPTKPDSIDVWVTGVAILVLIASTVVNCYVIAYALTHDYWKLGILSLGYCILGDWTLWWACRDIHYKDRPFRVGGITRPFLWPTRLQLIPIIPLFAIMLLKRVPNEMMTTQCSTHANIIYRFAYFYSVIRLLLHNIPMVCFFFFAPTKSEKKNYSD